MNRRQFVFPVELESEFEKLCQIESKTVSQGLRDAVRMYLRVREMEAQGFKAMLIKGEEKIQLMIL